MKTNRYLVLAVVCLCGALVPFMGSSINLALPQISGDLKMNAVALGWIVTAFLLASAIFQIPFSRVGDLFGRKKVLTAGVILFSFASIACALSPTGSVLIASRFVQGVASAMLFGVSMAIVTSVFPANERGKALGINTAVVYFAIAAGPFLGGMLTHHWGWRSIFVVTACLGLLALAGIFAFLKSEWVDAKGERYDWWGTLIYATGLTAIIYGCSILPSGLSLGFSLILVGVVSFIFFVHYEKRQAAPVFNIKMFLENRVFRMSSFAALINYAATFAIGFMLSLYLQQVKGFDAQKAGLILVIQPVVQTFISPLAGKWSDRVSAGKIATLGMSIIVVCLLAMLFLTPDTSVTMLFAILAVLGTGFGLFSSPNVNVIMGSVEKRYLGMASATTGTMRLTGQSISMGITMMMIAIFIGKTTITIANQLLFMQCLHYTFAVCMVLCLAGVYTSMVRNKK